MAERPSWIPAELYPFESRFAAVEGTKLHYVDEGSGPPLLMLHGNPTWSFLYREVIMGLRDSYRCVAVDHPGFGLSEAPPGYGYTPAEHARALEQLVEQLDLRDITLMAQDWGGPIGFSVAGRQPERFAAFVVGNTWAWPKSDPATQVFSRLMGGPLGRYLIVRRNAFVERVMPGAMRRRTLSEQVMDAYRGPFPDPESRRPVAVLPREILRSRPWLAHVEAGLSSLRDRPALLVWPTKDQAFGERERLRWEQLFAEHRTVLLEGAGHYIPEEAPEEIVAAVREWSTR